MTAARARPSVPADDELPAVPLPMFRQPPGATDPATGGAAAGADEPAAGPDEPATGPGRGTGSTAPGPDARPSRPYGHIFGW